MGDNVLLGASGEYSDFQEILKMLDDKAYVYLFEMTTVLILP